MYEVLCIFALPHKMKVEGEIELNFILVLEFEEM